MSLFKRAAVATDIHFGKKGDSDVHNQDCLAFVQWFVARALAMQCDVLILMGDWLDNRTRTRHDTAHYSKLAIDALTASGLPIIWIIGNHDLFFRDSRAIHGLEYLEKYPSITVVNEPLVIDNCLFCPWLVGDEYAKVIEVPVDYVFGHFELPTFLFNQMIEMPDRGGLHSDHFQYTKMIFSGHFHKRQMKRNAHGIPVWYIGNAFPHDFNDVNDDDRGMMILEHGADPMFETWPDQPVFRRTALSQVLTALEAGTISQMFPAKATVECENDMGLGDSDFADLRTYMEGKVRHFKLRPGIKVQLTEQKTDLDDPVLYTDVKEMVVDNIRKVDTQGRFDPDLLVECLEEVA